MRAYPRHFSRNLFLGVLMLRTFFSQEWVSRALLAAGIVLSFAAQAEAPKKVDTAQMPTSNTLVEEFISKALPMEFEGKTQTAYALSGPALEATVRNSASALVLPFDKVRSVKSVSFDWCTTRDLTKITKDMEQTKAGDDAALRLGLLLEGNPPMIPMFVPTWIRKLEKIVKFPTNKILYLTAGVASPSGASWVSPYTKYMSMVVPQSTPKKLSWCKNGNSASYTLPSEAKVTGLWYMADGDDTLQSFTTWISAIDVK